MKTDSIENKISTFVNDYLANEQKYNDCSITQNELQYDKCIIAYQLDTLILTKHNNNEKSRSRIKERNAVMSQMNVKKRQFNVLVKVGEKLSTFTIRSFYKQHFLNQISWSRVLIRRSGIRILQPIITLCWSNVKN